MEADVRLGATARKIIARIEDAPMSRLGYIGATLYKMQKGEVEVRDPPQKDEWRSIWNVYKRRKDTVGK